MDENGIRTTIEYTLNEDGKKVKVCVLFHSSLRPISDRGFVDHSQN